MSKRSILILLFISLAFNLAVLGGLFWLRVHRPPHPFHRADRKEGPKFPDRFAKHRPDPEISKIHEQFNQNKLLLMQELRKDPFDELYVKALMDSSIVTQGMLERRLGEKLLESRRQMTASEADEYFGKRIEFMTNFKRHIKDRRSKHEKDITDKP